MPLYRVDTISIFKMQYLVEASDVVSVKDIIVNNDDGEEVNQEWLGETIVTTSDPLSQIDYEKLCREAVNGHCAEELILKTK